MQLLPIQRRQFKIYIIVYFIENHGNELLNIENFASVERKQKKIYLPNRSAKQK